MYMAKTKLLIEDTEHEYDISKEDILTYAQQIGINTDKEKHLMWIAEQGLTANVPKPWLILSDNKDRIFYYNVKTNEKSWNHPLDKEYSALVSEERSKSKSLNSASSDYGFESKPLDSSDFTQPSGRFSKASPQLSSLADAPPLSSSGRNSPPPNVLGRNESKLSGRKFEFGQIENKRGTQLAPVRLNTLKMPPASATKSIGGMSFMPKGAVLSKNVRRLKNEAGYDNELDLHGHPPLDDSNESLNSDEGSKYSYEETDEEEKHTHGLEPYDMLDTSQLSPMHSADESPDALDINSLVQLGTKLPPRFDSIMKREDRENINKENSPSLNLRKVGQPSFLKPLSQNTKKKGSYKSSKSAKKGSKNTYPNESELEFDDKISAVSNEQRLMLEQIEKEWLTMQEELEKQEKEKYEEMLKDSSKKLEEEEVKLRKEHLEKLSSIKNEFQKKVENEQNEVEKQLEIVRASNKERLNSEEKKFQEELETLCESFKKEMKNLEEKNAAELDQKKKQLEESSGKEIENLKIEHDSNKKNIEESHLTEISTLQKAHKLKIEEIQSSFAKEEEEISNKVNESKPKKSELQEEIQNLEKLIKDETEKYQNLLKEKEKILKEITVENENLDKVRKEVVENQEGIAKLHDEVEKTENDLDLLQSEKSALISELNILKENINNEKSNLLKLENKPKSYVQEESCSKNFSEVGINTTSTFCNTCSKAVQVSVSCFSVSCQIENSVPSFSHSICQASSLDFSTSKSCQTDLVPSDIKKTIVKSSDNEELNSNAVTDKNLEKTLSGLSMKLDSRIGGIENQLRLLQESFSKPTAAQPISYNQEFVENQFTEVKTVPNGISTFYAADTSLPPSHFSHSIPVSSHKKCRCESGDTCDVLQDVKNSVYRLNDILCHNFVPPLSSNSFYQVNQPMNSYSSPFDSFYTRLRDMQEKQRLAELKHKCEKEAGQQKMNSSYTTDSRSFKNLKEKESSETSQNLKHSTLYSHHVPEDPVIRAKSIILREQARAWKEQQSLNSLSPHIFSMNTFNSTSKYSQSSVTGFSTSHSVPSSQQTFLNFDIDPETDYNMWMTRLNALQLRIRSHKIL